MKIPFIFMIYLRQVAYILIFSSLQHAYLTIFWFSGDKRILLIQLNLHV